MHDFYSENKEKIDRILFLVVVTVTVWLFFTVFFMYLAPFFFGIIIALIMEPLNRFMVDKIGFKRWMSSLLCLLFFMAVLGSLGAWLFNTLSKQVVSFIDEAPAHYEEIMEKMDKANDWLQRITDRLPHGWYIPNIEEMIPAVASMIVGDNMAESGWRTIGNIGDYFINVILGLVSAYFFMSDGKNIYRFVKNSFPEWFVKQGRQTKKGLKRAIGGYFKAQAILMLMTGIISVVGLMFLRSPYALLLGLLFAVLDFLPILGPPLVILPWILISIIMGNMQQAVGLLIIYGLIVITRQVMQPKILGDQMGAHPLASLMSIYVGFKVFGIFGLFIGPTLLMIFIALRDTDEKAENL